MRLKIAHDTVYRYEAPMRGVVQSLRLTPSQFEGQRVGVWQVTVSDGARGVAFRDGAGDWVESWTVRGPVSEITVSVRGEIETRDTAGVLRGHREPISPLVYLRATAATAPDAAIRALAEVGGGDDLARAHALAEAVAGAVAYRPGVTHAHTTAAQTLALAEGVCQDHAHVLIAAARSIGLPARYVSGYLHATEDGTPHEAAHAWAEIHVQGLGWVGFDAANRCCPDDRYVRLGSGLDAADASPIRGIAAGQAAEEIEVAVSVEQAEQASQQTQQ